MILLRNFYSANKVYDLRNKLLLTSTLNTKINGWYIENNDMFSAIYTIEYDLFLFVNEKEINITSDSYFAELVRLKDKENLKLYYDNVKEVEFIYDISESYSNVSPFEYIDDDDNNWGLFLIKIINDKNRKNNFIINLNE